MNPFLSNVPLHPRRDEAILAREDTVNQVYENVRSGNFCLILGPKYSGRTTLLRAVKARLQESSNYIPILVQPDELDVTGDGPFLESLAWLVQQALRTEKALPTDYDLSQYNIHEHADAFKSFLDDLLKRISRRLILFFDSIERLPPHPLVRVANIAHTMFVTRDSDKIYQNISFNFAGSISLRYLTFSLKPEVSPFNICTNIPLRDLSNIKARAFLDRIVDRFSLSFSPDSLSAIVDWVGGDMNMIQRVAGLALDASDRHVDSQTVKKIIETIVQSDPWHAEESLRHTADLIEEDHQALHLVLRLLHQPSVPYQPSEVDKALYSAFDITYPEMTGAVVLERPDGVPTNWTFRNNLTEMFLKHHFTPQRVTKTYLELGQIDDALRSCDALLNHIRDQFDGDMVNFDDSELHDVLMVFINRIRVDGSHEFGYELLARLLERGFGCTNATYFEYVGLTNKLSAVTFLSALFKNDGSEYDVVGTKDNEVLEVQAYRSQVFKAEAKGDELKIAIPLMNLVDDVTAVVTIHSKTGHKKWRNIDLRIRKIKSALQAINIALTQAENLRKASMIHSLQPLKGKSGATKIFVAHEFSEELLENLRGYLGRVSAELEFRYVDKTKPSGLLPEAILAEMKDCRLCLYEMSVPNNNVYFECGLGLGLNLPGILFARVKKESSKHPRIPPVLEGILYFNYFNYTSIMEDIASRLNGALDSYWDNQQDAAFIHFVGTKLTELSKRCSYAAILDHDHFRDQPDYRGLIDEAFKSVGMETAYPLDEQVAVGRYLNDAAQGSMPRLMNMMNLLRNADVIVSRVENIKSSRESHIAGQVFIGLGYGFGANETSKPKRLKILMTLLNQAPNGRHLDVPSDLKGYSFLRYSTLPELRTLLANALATGK